MGLSLRFAKAAPAKGSLLIATGNIDDPRFQKSVILLLQHGEEGTVGLIINKPLPIPVQHAVPGFPGDVSEEQPLFYGGPVGPQTSWVLFAGDEQPEGSVQILPGIFVANAEQFPAAGALKLEADQLKVLIGYAGWAPGQLEKELAKDDWKVSPARAAEIFDADPGSLWKYLSGQGAVLI